MSLADGIDDIGATQTAHEEFAQATNVRALHNSHL
jgi:hypothetical protein